MSLFLPKYRAESQAGFAKRYSVVANCEVPLTGKFYLQQLKRIDRRQRNTQVFLLFLGNATGFIVRFCMSVAIVAMTNKSVHSDSKVYNWDPGESNSIQGAFFWGFVVAQIPSSLIIGSWSAHKLLAVGMFASSLVNMAIPMAADWGYGAVMGCRIIMGLSQACILPCTHTLLSRWVTPLDRGRMGSFVMNGPQLGIVLTLTASGYLADSKFGWPSIFYASGAVGITWSVLFYCLGTDYPPEIDKIYHQNISTMAHSERLAIPWKSIVTSIPFWALVIVHCGHNFGFYTWLTQLPTYMKSILNFDISKSGAISALPYLTMWLMCFPISFSSDFALRRGMSITVARKICNSIGLWIPALATVMLCIIETKDEVVMVAIFSLAIGFNSGTCCGFQINHMDLSPSNFAGLLMSLTNTVANILGIIAPKICSMIVSDVVTVSKEYSTNLKKGVRQPYSEQCVGAEAAEVRERMLGQKPIAVRKSGETDSEFSFRVHCLAFDNDVAKKHTCYCRDQDSVKDASMCLMDEFDSVIKPPKKRSRKEVHRGVNTSMRYFRAPGSRERNVQIFLLFLGTATGYTLRFCMSVAIVAMTSESSNSDSKTYDWDSETTNSIQSAFFWGYVVAQVPSSYVISGWSAHKLLALGMFASSLVNMGIPLAAKWGYEAVMGCRIIMGLSQACLMPCAHTLLSRWVPPLERGRLGSFVMNGPQFGTVLALSMSGFLASSSFGWPSIFYTFGTVGTIWSVVFYWFGADYPVTSQTIYLKESSKINKIKKLEVPWKSILTSSPVWALMITHCGNNFGFYTWLTQLPTYMKSILDYDISKSGVVSALPYFTMWILGFPISYASDFALRRGMSIGVARKICNTIGTWIPAAAMLVLALIETNNEIVIIAVIVIAIGFNSGVCCGFQINHIDLSPHYSGQMMSVTNGLANVLGIVAPKISGLVISDTTNVSQWRIIFYITAVTYFGSNLIFLIFGKGDVQSWDETYSDDPNYKPQPRLSVISIASEPTALAVPESINEDDFKTYC
ncbi:hypothetical protein QAD02_016306 [Eretmocerus hayati]|uniref:Uncharacterized protein n=1 Tax=Eretmocerus hayati TaxID=131215 RepID=A0ACC2PB36_9HYME|nr:hypothetical protein QAD02_016306 [Eretmocerus hayati]